MNIGNCTIGGLKMKDPDEFKSLDNYSPKIAKHKTECRNKIFTSNHSFYVENAKFSEKDLEKQNTMSYLSSFKNSNKSDTLAAQMAKNNSNIKPILREKSIGGNQFTNFPKIKSPPLTLK